MREADRNATANWQKALSSMSIFEMIAVMFLLSGCCSSDPDSGQLLVKSISMPPWLEKLEAENAGRVIKGDEAKIRFVVELADFCWATKLLKPKIMFIKMAQSVDIKCCMT